MFRLGGGICTGYERSAKRKERFSLMLVNFHNTTVRRKGGLCCKWMSHLDFIVSVFMASQDIFQDLFGGRVDCVASGRLICSSLCQFPWPMQDIFQDLFGGRVDCVASGRLICSSLC